MIGRQDTTVSLSIIPGQELSQHGTQQGGTSVMVQVVPPEGESRVPSDIVCVVDVSGSMGVEAMLKNEHGQDAGHGLSVLDVVKHALKTIMLNLTESDRLGLIVYSNDARPIFPLTVMNDTGKATTQRLLEDLQPTGMTNLWDGLKIGFEMFKQDMQDGHLRHMMLFTDGLPNINPPRGIFPMLKKLKDREPMGKLPCTINTFGFGYELDSEMLSQLAIEGCGAYAFIPDAGFVGTVFVNSLSNLLVTMASETVLTLQPTNGASFAKSGVLGGHPTRVEGTSLVVNLGSLQYGQTKDVIVKMTVPKEAVSSYLQATVTYSTCAGVAPPASAMGTSKGGPGRDLDVEQQRLRLEFVDCVRRSMQACKRSSLDKAKGKPMPLGEGQAVMAAFIAEVEASPVVGVEAIAGLLEDARGQVAEALSREDWYTKWGVHYLPSLMFAHLTQQCNNFKDAGVQAYGGALFDTLRSAADDIFLTLPPPTPMAPPPQPVVNLNNPQSLARMLLGPIPANPQPAPVQMAAFHDRFAGCIDGTCSVRLVDGSSRHLGEVRRGDLLETAGGGHAQVACVVRTRAPESRFLLTELPGGLRITPYHPVRLDGKWCFPAELANAQEMPCEAVYTLLLEEGAEGAMLVEGIPCVSLGHGLEEGAAQHPFFGDRAAVQAALAKLPGFEDGLVDLTAGSIVRDPETGLVCSFAAV